MKILIKITKNILERSMMCGQNLNKVGENCAVALALRDVFPNAYVTGSFINIEGGWGGTNDSIMLPENAVCFIASFDVKKPHERPLMRLFSFEIDVPDSVIESIGIDEVKQILSNSKTLEYVG